MTERRLGYNIRIARERAEFTQAELAHAIGKKPSVIGSYERADVEPPLSVLQAIAGATKTTLLDLLGLQVSPQDLIRALMDQPAICTNPGPCESCQPIRGIVVGVLIADEEPHQ